MPIFRCPGSSLSRKVWGLSGLGASPCHHLLGQVQLLYEVEREARGLDEVQRQAMRDQQSRPIGEALIEWCEVQAADA
ncbi:MAG: hypothetical protein JJU36_12905 [Phycisphaeraceae bacterium]|nr:hypothetical protein [Phycisphaeraceae bacterium]